MSYSESLRVRWESLLEGISSDVGNKWWTKINDSYSQPTRRYHNLQHLAQMFELLDKFEGEIRKKNSVAFAIFFHDLCYDPQAVDNEEKSSELFHEFASEAEISSESPLYNEVKDLILLTKTHLTEEHKAEGITGTEDKHFFLDFDMTILGSDPQEYEVYSKAIRQEYSFLPQGSYNGLRAKVLKSFLMIPNIFATDEFRKMYETKARKNIQREINSLET